MAWQKRNLFSSAVNMSSGGSVPWPSYLTGGLTGDPTTSGPVMPTQLFEEGDQDINMALNNMSSTTNPSLDQIKDTEMPVVEDEMAMDQGPDNFESALSMLKQEFYDEIGSFISKTKDMAQIEKYLKGLNSAYTNELTRLKKDFGIEEIHPEEELLTPSFIAELQAMVTAPEMVYGGLVTSEKDLVKYGIQVPWEVWQMGSEEEKDNWIGIGLSAKAGATTGVEGVNEGQEAMMARINKIIEDRKLLAKDAYAPPTKQGGILGFATQYNATKAAQSAAKDKALADEMDVIQYGNRYGTKTTGTGPKMTAELQNRMFEKPDPTLDPGTIYKKILDEAASGSLAPEDPSSYVPVRLAIMGQQALIEQYHPNFGVIKTYKGVPTNFSDYVKQRQIETITIAEEDGKFGDFNISSNSRQIAADFLRLKNDEG